MKTEMRDDQESYAWTKQSGTETAAEEFYNNSRARSPQKAGPREIWEGFGET
jgi:hypothetical protein